MPTVNVQIVLTSIIYNLSIKYNWLLVGNLLLEDKTVDGKLYF